MQELKTVVIMDYQNVHLTAAQLFEPYEPLHEQLIDPLLFAQRLLVARAESQKATSIQTVLQKVIVYRGLPSATYDPEAYSRNLAQKAAWERDPRVLVHHRPLKYKFEHTADGKKATDKHGRTLVKSKQEKGIDVLCAITLLKEAANSQNDLVILCSQDSDLEPALDMALGFRGSRVETSSWYVPKEYWSKEIRPSNGKRIWNTRLDRNSFIASLDRENY